MRKSRFSYLTFLQKSRFLTRPIGHAGIEVCCIRAFPNDFRCRLAVDGPMHLVLYRSEETARSLRARLVVNTGGIDVEHLAPKFLFTASDVPNSFEKLVKIAVSLAQLVALVIENKSLDKIVTQLSGSPPAKLDTSK